MDKFNNCNEQFLILVVHSSWTYEGKCPWIQTSNIPCVRVWTHIINGRRRKVNENWAKNKVVRDKLECQNSNPKTLGLIPWWGRARQFFCPSFLGICLCGVSRLIILLCLHKLTFFGCDTNTWLVTMFFSLFQVSSTLGCDQLPTEHTAEFGVFWTST